MSADRGSEVVDADVDTATQQPAPDHASTAKRPGTDKPDNVQQVRDEDHQTRGYDGPFESREAEFAARWKSRENVAAYNDVPEEKPEEGEAGSVPSADKPAADKTKDQPGQGIAESPSIVEGVESPNATTREQADRAPGDSGQPEPGESDQYVRPSEIPQPASDGEQPPLADQAEAGVSSDAGVKAQSSADFGSPLPGEEHIPITRAESRARTTAINAELQGDKQGGDRIAEAVGQPAGKSAEGFEKGDSKGERADAEEGDAPGGPETAQDTEAVGSSRPGETVQDVEGQRALERIRDVLELHPEVASVVERLVADKAHPLDVTKAVEDPARRNNTLGTIKELADGKLLADRDLEIYRRDNPGRGRLFEQVSPETNLMPDGRTRKDAYIADAKAVDPARAVGSNPDADQHVLVEDYARRLKTQVQPTVWAEISTIVADYEGTRASIRTKDADAILDKVNRMTSGSETRPPRPGYETGDVIDAVGARVTVRDADQLAQVLQGVKDRYGTGDEGRILEIENMYASPKPANPDYRVVPVVIGADIGGRPYTFELQLTTTRASVAADLVHNTAYKPYTEPSPAEREKITGMMAEAAALDQEETRKRNL